MIELGSGVFIDETKIIAIEEIEAEQRHGRLLQDTLGPESDHGPSIRVFTAKRIFRLKGEDMRLMRSFMDQWRK